MKTSVQFRRRSVTGSIVLMLLCFLFAPSTRGQTKPQSTSSQSSALPEALRNSFGAVVEAVALVKPFFMTGDFNGDGAQDIIVVVRVKGRRTALPKDVRLLNPFEPEGGIVFPADPAKANKFALAIIHSWKAPKPAAKFLLIGDSPILILENSRPTSGPEAGGMELMSRRGKLRKGESFPRTSKGDVVLMVTEVGGDSRLYWNGRTYRWEDSPDD